VGLSRVRLAPGNMRYEGIGTEDAFVIHVKIPLNSARPDTAGLLRLKRRFTDSTDLGICGEDQIEVSDENDKQWMTLFVISVPLSERRNTRRRIHDVTGQTVQNVRKSATQGKTQRKTLRRAAPAAR
jgi:hypothetical protein